MQTVIRAGKVHAGIQRRALGTARRKEQRVAPQERPDRLLRLPGRQLIRQQLRHHGRAARRGMQVASQARADRVQSSLYQQAAVKFDLDLRVGHAAARDLPGDIAVAGAVQRKVAQKPIEIRRFRCRKLQCGQLLPCGAEEGRAALLVHPVAEAADAPEQRMVKEQNIRAMQPNGKQILLRPEQRLHFLRQRRKHLPAEAEVCIS